jgi:Zn ribbon nucleic-acid-binding protein
MMSDALMPKCSALTTIQTWRGDNIIPAKPNAPAKATWAA